MSGLKPFWARVGDDSRVVEQVAEAPAAAEQEHCQTVPVAIKITVTIAVAVPLVLR